VEYILKNYNKPYTVTIRQLDLTYNKNYRPQLRRVKKSLDFNIVICSSIDALPDILKQAQQVGLMSDKHQIIITSLDMHTIDLEPFQHSETIIVGLRMVNPDDEFVKTFAKDWAEKYQESKKGRDDVPEGLTAEQMRVETAMTYDAVMLVSNVMLDNRGIKSEPIECDDITSVFNNGTTIFNSMKTIRPFRGLSGNIEFDQHGNRENYELELLSLNSDGLKIEGTWHSKTGLHIPEAESKSSEVGDVNSLRNKTLLVLTVIVSCTTFLSESFNESAFVSDSTESALWNVEREPDATQRK